MGRGSVTVEVAGVGLDVTTSKALAALALSVHQGQPEEWPISWWTEMPGAFVAVND
jgi:hypothetical protein